MNRYRTHTCGQLRASDIGKEVKLAGWIHRKRNLGNLCFVDLRDHYGITQCVVDSNSDLFEKIEGLRVESVIGVSGEVVARESVNKHIPTGDIELKAKALEVYSEAPETLPVQVAGDGSEPEEIRLKYRFLDLRREKIHNNMILRSKVIAYMRKKMVEQGFTEYQTPILTASSPEGARDFLVPSRINPGKFYALPQAPQQFKQLLMVSGFDRYFQIAPCFRDEDPRADRSPGEFYQLDMEMSFVEQEDVFQAIEYVMGGVFNEFSNGRKVDQAPFRHIPFREAMLKYGSDKPDLRNPLEIADNMKKQGGFIPGIRPGKPTSDYLNKILNYLIFIGACGLTIVCVLPYVFNGVFGASVSFGGTSLIIIVSVLLETLKQIESQMMVRNYKGFLND